MAGVSDGMGEAKEENSRNGKVKPAVYNSMISWARPCFQQSQVGLSSMEDSKMSRNCSNPGRTVPGLAA